MAGSGLFSAEPVSYTHLDVYKRQGYTGVEAGAAIAQRRIDAVAFGSSFLANPDLPERIRAGPSLNKPDPTTFYTPGAEGYTDYPSLSSS